MDSLTVVMGVVVILYGAFMLYTRFTNPTKLGKLEAMQARWGEAAGGTLHLIAYDIVPTLVGVAILFAGLSGVSIMEFLAA
ncbi:MAG: hypothetical protein AAF902_02135 [Chloroflexota bacterium]